MADQGQDEAFSKYVLHTGVVRIEQLEAAREEHCAQTQRDFGDGEVRIRFSVTESSYLQFTMRQGREGGYGVVFNRNALAQVQGDQELVFTCRGANVTATLNGKPQTVQARGAPLTGRLQFGVLDGRLRIAAIEFSPE